MRRLALALFTSLFLFVAASANVNESSTARQSTELDEAKQLTGRVVNLYEQGKFDEALPLAKRALEIRERALGREHQLIIESLINLAELELAKKRYRESLSLYERALKINEKLAGADDAGNAVLLDKIAYLGYMTGESSGPENSYKRALAIREKLFGSQDEQVAQSAYNLAEFYRFTNNYSKADVLYKRALEIRDRNLPKDDAKIERTVDRYKCLLYQSERMDKLKEFEEARRTLDPSYDPAAADKLINSKALNLAQPNYPSEAKYMRASGVIVIRVTIDESGKVIKAEDACGGNSLLIKAAVAAAYNSRFSPTLLSGQPVRVTGLVTYKFRLGTYK